VVFDTQRAVIQYGDPPVCEGGVADPVAVVFGFPRLGVAVIAPYWPVAPRSQRNGPPQTDCSAPATSSVLWPMVERK
jgi:hypothetical protein